MIITGLLNLIHLILNSTLTFSIPTLPYDAYGYVGQAFKYMVSATGIVANYTPLSYLLVLFGVILAVDVALLLYHFIMWILRKIPMLGIE